MRWFTRRAGYRGGGAGNREAPARCGRPRALAVAAARGGIGPAAGRAGAGGCGALAAAFLPVGAACAASRRPRVRSGISLRMSASTNATASSGIR